MLESSKSRSSSMCFEPRNSVQSTLSTNKHHLISSCIHTFNSQIFIFPSVVDFQLCLQLIDIPEGTPPQSKSSSTGSEYLLTDRSHQNPLSSHMDQHRYRSIPCSNDPINSGLSISDISQIEFYILSTSSNINSTHRYSLYSLYVLLHCSHSLFNMTRTLLALASLLSASTAPLFRMMKFETTILLYALRWINRKMTERYGVP